MDIDILTTEITALIVNADGTHTYETRPRETPLDFSAQHHEIIDAHWRSVRLDRDAKLAATDWVVARAYERGEPVPSEWVTYRQALRDVTKQNNPFLVVWPEAPVIVVPPTPAPNTVPPGEIPTSTL